MDVVFNMVDGKKVTITNTDMPKEDVGEMLKNNFINMVNQNVIINVKNITTIEFVEKE